MPPERRASRLGRDERWPAGPGTAAPRLPRGAPVIGVRVRLTFPEELVREPIVPRLVQTFDVVPNIRRADVGEHSGWIVCELDGDATAVDQALDWLRDQGVRVDLLGDVVES